MSEHPQTCPSCYGYGFVLATTTHRPGGWRVRTWYRCALCIDDDVLRCEGCHQPAIFCVCKQPD